MYICMFSYTGDLGHEITAQLFFQAVSWELILTWNGGSEADTSILFSLWDQLDLTLVPSQPMK